MNGFRSTLAVLVIVAAYVGGAALVGTLLASKMAGPPPRPPDPQLRDVRVFLSQFEVRPYYRAQDHVDVLQKGSLGLKVLSADEFLQLVARPACVSQRIPYTGTDGHRETVSDQECLTTVEQKDDLDASYPQTYLAVEMCRPLYPAARPDGSQTSFRFHDAEACMDAAAKGLQWTAYHELKGVCVQDAKRDLSSYPGSRIENIVRECVVETLVQWANRERDRCMSSPSAALGKCR